MSPFMRDPSETAEKATIPVLDFSSWTDESTLEERTAIGKQLVDACRGVGFVYIINHGVPAEELEEAFRWSKKLFDLEMEEKLLAPHPEGFAHHRGYSWPGLEKVSQQGKDEEDKPVGEIRKVSDCKESYEIGAEDNPDQPNIWLPEPTVPGFRAFMTSFYATCVHTSRRLLQALALGLDLGDASFLDAFHSGRNHQLRLLHYPPVPAATLASRAIARMPAHTDWGTLTMLFQDDCGGLEVEDPARPGEFVVARPVEGALVMNVGDLLERWTNNQLRSTLHRVAAPPLADRYTGNGHDRLTRARYSIPFFVSPDADAVVRCLPSCTDAARPPRYAPVRQADYCLMRGSAQYPARHGGEGEGE